MEKLIELISTKQGEGEPNYVVHWKSKQEIDRALLFYWDLFLPPHPPNLGFTLFFP